MHGNQTTDLTKLKAALIKAAASDTSADPDNWTDKNPLWGHCAIAALIAQEYFGGGVVRHDLSTVPELAYLRSHYTNSLPNGDLLDITSEQFMLPLPKNLSAEIRSRSKILSHEDTKRRYSLLKQRVEALL